MGIQVYPRASLGRAADLSSFKCDLEHTGRCMYGLTRARHAACDLMISLVELPGGIHSTNWLESFSSPRLPLHERQTSAHLAE